MESPVSVGKNGVKFRPEEMERERLYHCVFRGKAMLIFKDAQDVMNCYEVDDADLVDKIAKCTDDKDLEVFFDAYLSEQNINN